MSLQVWLPLTKDTRQQGLSSISVTGSPAAWNNGKLGKCAYWNGAVANVLYNNTTDFNYTDNFSVAFWANPVYTGSTVQYAWTVGRADAGGYGYGFQIINATTAYFRFGNGSYSVSAPSNEWHHFVMTVGNSKVTIYKDGSQVSSNNLPGTIPTYSDGNGMGLGCFHYSGNIYPYYGSLNDFRIYDHCLSPMEVKQLSQGLILHYPLNRNGWGQENLHKYSDILTTAWTKDQATVADGIVTITPTTNADRRMYQMPANGAWTWQANTKYTASVEAKSTNGAQLVFYPYGGNTSGSSAITVTSEWKRYSYSFTTGGSPTTGSMTYSVNQTSGVTLQLRHPKLELGSVATPWCPNSSDALATTMGLNGTTEYDCSGFCNNANSNGSVSLTYSSDTPKYNVSTVFASGARIATPISASTFLPTDAITVSIWFKSTNAANRFLSCTEGGGFNFESASGKISFPIYITGKGYTRVDGNTTWSEVSDNKWHMITATYDKQNTILYVDGQLDKSTVSSYPNIDIGYSTITPFTLGAEAQTITSPIAGTYVGNLSDCRIYATALSADDVKSLYQNCATIDPDGTIRGQIRS